MEKFIKTTRKVALGFLFLVIAAAVYGWYNRPIVEGTSPDETRNQLALKEIKREPKVKDVVLTDANVLYAAVHDDGTRRDLYAQYLCGVLKEHGSSVSTVKVVKYGSMKDPDRDNAYGILLGECHCN